MVKQLFHKICSIALALLVLVATASFTVQQRFCHDTLINVSVFNELEECKEDVQPLYPSGDAQVECCLDEINTFLGQDTYNDDRDHDLSDNQKLLVTVFAYAYASLFQELSWSTISLPSYSPPEFTTDRLVLHQVFLI